MAKSKVPGLIHPFRIDLYACGIATSVASRLLGGGPDGPQGWTDATTPRDNARGRASGLTAWDPGANYNVNFDSALRMLNNKTTPPSTPTA